eukprot:Blabericola_migrator_1__2975@NODE_185_length_11802_cov_66_327567_g160_i0_p3_GENE_NODE_185_length_11802_cov_66_327567_g160_i0NODE_185_length_11802_cov_66_327567_g160_i0_p3_ORF_typecomplete_len598_score104_86Pkinase/PF00069_25/4_2e71Pkinase_Tyr/PF07714_17/3_8e41EFhand_7/PF13499_6/1_5e09EFhand_7/PF13499_6/5_7e07EFhand_6/PF13405_6/0_0031EFhand_6/PF13405_6/1_7e02EFhand_6/PF13405_6/1_7e06EFhand_6/PF13405_6/10Kinaselike/PF14531_6/1_1e13Kinaselike/PF14531_6/1_2e03EFhand_11/PF08976_11/2_4e06EFhand_11/PF0
MGCAICKPGVRPQATPPSSQRIEAPHKQLAVSNTVEGKSGSPHGDAGEVTDPAATQVGSNIMGSQTQNPAIRRVAAASMDDDREESEAITSSKGDISTAKAPSYKVRKSILTARVKIGETNLIFQKYHLTDDILGTGISGAVRVAVEKSTGRQYAIKTLNLENITAKKAAMLHNEVDIYLKLDHPNIAKLVEVYEDEKRIFLVMELCTGRELYDRLAAKKRYREADAARVTQQMLEAINYCHKHRICHRDLKLENWVYASEAEDAPLKLIDFGFSRIFNPVIPMTAMHGTVYYVSPEVMDGCYREKCDIWSIGVIVYMLLSGTPPFNGSVDYQILVKIRNANYNFDGAVWSTISETAKDFIRSLLVRDPNERPSAEEALKHKWLQQTGEVEDNEIDVGVLKAMRSFALGNAMKRAALGLVAFSFSNDEVQGLYKEFKKLDKDRTGAIRLDQLVSALMEHLHMTDKEAIRVFEKIDQTGNREVQYTEFLAATLHAKMLTDETWTREAFERMDVDRDGVISLSDLRQVLGETFNGVPIQEIMDRCASPSKSTLTFDEFRAVLTSPEGSIDCENGLPGKDSSLETRLSLSDAVVSIHLAS